jgi:tetratricopeptide (TPR) repeat protein
MPLKPITTQRAAVLCAVVSLLTACNAPPRSPAPGNGSYGTGQPAPGGTEPAPQRAPEPPPPAPSAPPTPAAQAQASRIATAAIDLLEAGHEDQARAELQHALTLDPNNRLAQNLMRQITADPVATLGRESFPYTVRPSDTLSRIAGRFMGDIYSFYILARYNDIKVPRLVAGGQVIRIPGKAPPPGALEREARKPEAPPPKVEIKVEPRKDAAPPPAPAPAPPAPPPPPPEPTPGERAMRNAEAAERAGNLDLAHGEYKRAAGLEQPGAAAKADEVRRKLVARYTSTARTAFVKQDLDGSIRAWDKVLDLDPNNDTAKLERQKAQMLKKKVEGLK